MLPLLLELLLATLPCNLHHHDIIAAPYCIKSSHQFGGFVMVKCPWVTSSYKRKKTVILRLLHNLRCSLARQSASHSDFAFSRQPPTQHGMDHDNDVLTHSSHSLNTSEVQESKWIMQWSLPFCRLSKLPPSRKSRVLGLSWVR